MSIASAVALYHLLLVARSTQ